MNTEAKKQYMETLREKYFKINKKEKRSILDEYCRIKIKSFYGVILDDRYFKISVS